MRKYNAGPPADDRPGGLVRRMTEDARRAPSDYTDTPSMRAPTMCIRNSDLSKHAARRVSDETALTIENWGGLVEQSVI